MGEGATGGRKESGKGPEGRQKERMVLGRRGLRKSLPLKENGGEKAGTPLERNDALERVDPFTGGKEESLLYRGARRARGQGR